MRPSKINAKARSYIAKRLDPRAWNLKKVVQILIFIILLVFIAIFGILNTTSRINDNQIALINRQVKSPSKPWANFTGVAIYANVTGFYAVDRQFKLHMDFSPIGSFVDVNDDLARSPSIPLFLSIDSKTLVFPASQNMAALDISLTGICD